MSDPTMMGHLRYWDGAAWTDWVRSDGQTTHVPLMDGHVALDPLRVTDAAIRQDPVSPGIASLEDVGDATVGSPWHGSYPRSWLARIGSGLVVCGGVCAIASIDEPVTRQIGPAGSAVGYDSDVRVVALGLAMVVAGAAGAWLADIRVRLAALLAAAIATTTIGLIVIGARTGSRLRPGVSVQLARGWHVLVYAVVFGLLGCLVTMRWPTGRAGPRGRQRATLPYAVVGLVLGLLGLVVAPLAAVACMCGGLGRFDAHVAVAQSGRGTLSARVQTFGGVAFGLWCGVLFLGILLLGN